MSTLIERLLADNPRLHIMTKEHSALLTQFGVHIEPGPKGGTVRLRVDGVMRQHMHLPMAALNSLVSEAVDIVVHCTRSRELVKVTEVVAVEELQTGRDATAFTITPLFVRARADAPLGWSGNLPVRASRPLDEAGYDVRALLDPAAVR